MSLIETESLILKSYNLAEADKIVVLFTHDHGVVRGVAKGAKRLKSKFGSGLEPFSIIKVTYFEKEVVELVSIQKVELVKSYFRAASDPDFLHKFSYLSDILLALSPPHDPNETLYRMVKACLETADNDLSSLLAVGVYFEMWLLRLNGLMPDWAHCGECRRTFDEAESADLTANYHLLCVNCRRSASPIAFDGRHREIISAVQRTSPADFAKKFAGSKKELDDLSIVLKRLLSHAIGREIAAERTFVYGNPL
ncbi:MAG: DNA repair protein RecO [Pyrinomonadaceae bacterium]|nr:DNA repair protein RecO [Pyrinomonadaceae bacterium]